MKIHIDEAGRGPLAGPVHVGLVISGDYALHVDYTDSKQLTENQREFLYQQITKLPKKYRAVGSSCAQEIDQYGIVWAIHTAIMRGLQQRNFIEKNGYELYIDGPADFGLQKLLNIQCTTIVKGDQKNTYISMASILAKVTRDREMIAWDKKHPIYGFAKHKGYGTAQHRNAIMTHGLSPLHRKTFCKNIAIRHCT